MTLVHNTLEARYGCTLTFNNRAVSGYTMGTLGINGNIAAALADHADLYIISVGRNDCVADAAAYVGLPVQGYHFNSSMRAIEVMIREVRRTSPQADILLHTENPLSVYSSDADMRVYLLGLQRLAAAYGCEFTDGYAAFYAYGDYSGLMFDTTHPNAAGHALHATTIYAAFPATAALAPRTIPGFSTDGGLYTPETVDPTVGTFGWTVLNAPAVNGAGAWVNTGTWSGTNPTVTTTANDYAEFTFFGTELALSLSTAAADALVVDVTLDGAALWTNQSMTVLASTFQPYVIFTSARASGQHVLRITLKTGTMRLYHAAWLAGPPVVAATTGLRRMKAGRYYFNAHDSGSTAVTIFAAGDCYAVPLWVPTTTTFDQIAVNCTTLAASSTLTLGLFRADDYDQPGQRILVTAPLDSSTTGAKTATIAVTLTRGYYWLTVLALGGIPRVSATNQPTPLVAPTGLSVTNPLCGFVATAQAATPTTWVATTGAMTVPLIALRAI